LEEWHCNTFTDLLNEMELWDWNVANKDFWSRWAKSKSVSHMGTKNGPKTRLSARPWKHELDNGNEVHPEMQNRRLRDRG